MSALPVHVYVSSMSAQVLRVPGGSAPGTLGTGQDSTKSAAINSTLSIGVDAVILAPGALGIGKDSVNSALVTLGRGGASAISACGSIGNGENSSTVRSSCPRDWVLHRHW